MNTLFQMGVLITKAGFGIEQTWIVIGDKRNHC